MTGEKDVRNEAFQARREAARTALDALPGNYADDSAGRGVFFDAVYERAANDAAAVPWADLAPKRHLVDWLAREAGDVSEKRAVDIACGLGDNAEAIAARGYRTVAFDVVEKAVAWARGRFPASPVDYRIADLFDLPPEWRGAFDLVHECYTLQALPRELLEEAAAAVAALVAPGGRLLLYTRFRGNGTQADGPPWPLEEKYLRLPEKSGLTKIGEERFELRRGERIVPHSFSVWRRSV